MQVGHSREELGSASPGGVAHSPSKRPVTLSIPGLIWHNPSRCDHICWLLMDSAIISASCCLVLTYRILTAGREHTSNSQRRSMRWVRGRCRSAMLRAFPTGLMTASLSSAMVRAVFCTGRFVYAKYLAVWKLCGILGGVETPAVRIHLIASG